jgi:UPF0148 protein
MKNADEIMAEYLLKGGKMLSKTCQTCGTPLFEYKGETLCVVCREQKETGANESESASSDSQAAGDSSQVGMASFSPEVESIRRELFSTLITLCARVREEQRPEDCLILMECIEKGVDALTRL